MGRRFRWAAVVAVSLALGACASRAETVRIATWNLKAFGREGRSSLNGCDVPAADNRAARADVVAVQEMESRAARELLFRRRNGRT